MIIDGASLDNHQAGVGGKTRKLKDLLDLELNVPKFFTIPADAVVKMIGANGKINQAVINDTVAEIRQTFKCKAYAVRSSALAEDSAKESLAGQFKTKINVPAAGLAAAMTEVIEQAYGFLEGKIEKFSLIIQDYIEPDFSGITFTRDPLGERKMVVEFHSGRGEEIVGGKVKPDKIELLWNSGVGRTRLPKLKEAIEKFQALEKFYHWPQDVEWCIKDNVWYWLQSRPITSLSKTQYEQILYLDQAVPKTEDFYFTKTEISEIAPRPTEFTLGLLAKIYGSHGPVAKTYKKYQVNYHAHNFIKIFGNELLCDKEAEIKTLLPAYSYFPLKKIQPRIKNLSKLIGTFKNLYHLHQIKLAGRQEIVKNLEQRIKAGNVQAENFSEIIDNFLESYGFVFEANLLAQFAIKKLETITRSSKNINIPTILGAGHKITPELASLQINIDSNKCIGNSLEIADESDFLGKTKPNAPDTGIFDEWWNLLPAWRKKTLEQAIKNAVIFNHLRELGRYLVVKEISAAREFLTKIAAKQKFKNTKDIYFAKFEEIAGNQISEEKCGVRKEKYEQYAGFNIPKSLMSIIASKERQLPLGASSGIARGVLVESRDIDGQKHKNTDIILYTKILSPDLAQYFPKIKGVVSEEGGLLSHLAIIAREQKIPVIVNYNPENSGIKLGDILEINGDNGEVKKI